MLLSGLSFVSQHALAAAAPVERRVEGRGSRGGDGSFIMESLINEHVFDESLF